MNLRRHQPFTLLQASQNNPGLAKLMALQEESRDRLKVIEPLIPAALRSHVQCGPIEDGVWCLLLSNNTTAAKLRQLLPDFATRLKAKNLEVKAIRLKVNREK
ncbi:hypothetical protein [Rhodoferax sp.]|uniref:hypothetical protein n=1 Tax=Rhodoferax sp. TaxID=50421 RepID=UPI00261173CB|nr:hypothetical protein [Rhodoferax sp.]MDD2924401.1 hypothetical protein [Rhodoferax sp.]